MRIVEPSCAILDELDHTSAAQRVEYCGRVCYKSEARIDADSAGPFVLRMLENEHLSVLEMAVLTRRLVCDAGHVDALFAAQPRFFQIDRLADGELLLTASIRAIRDFALSPGGRLPVMRALVRALRNEEPLFFADLPDTGDAPDITISKVPLAEVEKLPPRLLARHRFLAVKFVVNRAVSHELVRHRPCSFLQESQRYCRYGAERFGGEVAFIRPLFFAEGSPEFALWRESMATAEAAYLRLLETSTPQAARTVLPNSCKTELIVFAHLEEWRHIVRLRTSPAADPSMREVMVPLQEALARRWPGIF